MSPALLEFLEDRRLMSASVHAHHLTAHAHHSAATVHSVKASSTSKAASNTTYSALQTSVAAAATELQTLATQDGITIDPNTVVRIRKVNSTTTYYSVVLNPTSGTTIRLVTDQAGNPVTAPTSSKTTFGDASIPAAASAEITSLASVLGATAPVSTDSVTVRTANGLTTYSVSLAPSATTTSTDDDGDTDTHNIRITVDAAGNPAGNTKIPFSAVTPAVATGLNALATKNSTTIPSTQNVFVRTGGGVTTYTVYLASSGQSLSLTVDTTGAETTPASGFGDGFGGHHGGGFGFGGEGGGGFGFGGGRHHDD